MEGFDLYMVTNYYKFPSNSAPALNFTTFLAAILIVAPVCGFLPSLAALSDTDQEPKPTKDTLPPFFKVAPTLLKNDSKANLAAAFEIPESAAIASINSDLFIILVINCWLKIMLIVTNLGGIPYHARHLKCFSSIC